MKLFIIIIMNYAVHCQRHTDFIYDSYKHYERIDFPDSGPTIISLKAEKYDFNYYFNKDFYCSNSDYCSGRSTNILCGVHDQPDWSAVVLRFAEVPLENSTKTCGMHDWTIRRKLFNNNADETCIAPFTQSMYAQNKGNFNSQYFTKTMQSYPRALSGAGLLCHVKYTFICIPYLYQRYSIITVRKNEQLYVRMIQTNVDSTVILFHYIRADCQANYGLDKCWYPCKVGRRNSCNGGIQQCKDNWGFVRVVYFHISGEISLMEECLFRDVCNTDKCRGTDCIPYSNNTYVCSTAKPHYLAQNEELTYNASDGMAVLGDRLTCHIDVANEVLNRSFAIYEIISNNKEEHQLFAQSDPSTIIPMPNIVENYIIDAKCIMGIMEGYIFKIFISKLWFVKRGEKLLLFNTSIGFGKAIYIGQNIKCVTDGWPLRYYYFTLKILTNNFDGSKKIDNERGDKNTTIYIPKDARLGAVLIECYTKLDFGNGRKTVTFEKVYDFSLRTYVHFGWFHLSKNVYYYDEYLECSFQAFIEGEIYFRQFEGMIQIDAKNQNFIHLDFPYGGDYGFFCVLEFPDTQFVYSKRKEFQLFQSPRFVCFQLFPFMYGIFIQCNSNSYPSDMVYTEITISDVGQYEIYANSEGNDYVRVPYDLPISRAYIKCTISYTMDYTTVSMSINRTVTFKRIFVEQISHDERSKECLHYGTIMEQEDMNPIGKGLFEFHKSSFTLIPKLAGSLSMAPEMFIFFLPFGLTLLFFFVYNIKLLESGELLVSQQICVFNKQAIYRRLNDKLNRNATSLLLNISDETNRLVDKFNKMFEKTESVFDVSFIRKNKSVHLKNASDYKKSMRASQAGKSVKKSVHETDSLRDSHKTATSLKSIGS